MFSTPEKYKIEFSEKGIVFNGTFIKNGSAPTFNKTPNYLIGKTFEVTPLHLNNYIIEKEIYDESEEIYDKFEEIHKFLGFEKITKEKIVFLIDNSIYNISHFPSMFTVPLILDCPEIEKYEGILLPPVGSEEDFEGYLIPDEINQTGHEIKTTGYILASKYKESSNFKDLNYKYLRTKGKEHEKMNPTIRCKIIYGIASIMKYVHESGIIHQNLIPENIELDENLEPRIVGFDFLNPNAESDGSSHFDIYTAPEILNSYDRCSFPVDVYSFGLIVYSMFSNEFIGMSQRNLLKFSTQISAGMRPSIPSNVPENYQKLIEHCWDNNPNYRTTFSEIVEFLKNNDFSLKEFGMETDAKSLHEYQSRIDNIGHKEKDQIFFGSDDKEFIKVIEKVGEGSTSNVYKVIDTRTNRFMCKKVLKADDTTTFKDLQNAIKEFEFLRSFSHPCLCKAIAINTSEEVEGSNSGKTTVSLYLEYFQYNFKKFLNSDIMNNTLKTRIVVDIAHAMAFLHKNHMIYRDLKAENVMLNDVFEAKVVDFGLIKMSECLRKDYSFVSDSLTKGVGTFDYMSPEMLNEDDYNEKTDVYSYGVLLYYVFTGVIPKLKLKDKLSGKIVQMPEESDSITQFCIDVIKSCLSFKPDERPSFENILSDMESHSFNLASHVDTEVIKCRFNQLKKYLVENK